MRGPEIRFRIRSSIDRLDRRVRDLRASREMDAAHTTTLAEQRERLFRSLTELYLPELGQETVDELKQRLPAAHQRLDSILRAKRDELRRLDDQRDGSGARRTESVEQLDALTERIEELALERDRLTERVSAALASDTRHAQMAEAVEQTGLRREQAQRRHDAAVLERDEKAPAYENDVLFGYLLRRHYGTPDYNPSRLTGRLDGWVANKVSFERQHQSYRLLRELPEVAQAGLAENERAYEDAATRLGELEKSIEDLHGLTRVVEQGETLYGERQALVDRIEEIDAAVKQATERLKELESSRGPYYEQARHAVSDLLESRPIPRLREIALSTATRKDDRLAKDLERWEQEWAAVRKRLDDLAREERDVAVKLDELRQVENRFRRKDFDASNSTFAQGLDFDGLLKSFLAGGLTIRKLWEAIARTQRFERTRYQQAGPVIEAILWEVLRHSTRGGRGGGGRRGGWGGRGGGGGGTSGGFGGFGGFGGGSSTTGGFG